MPESIIQDKYIDQIPRFNLPPEFSNEPKETKEAPAEVPAEPKPATEAVAEDGAEKPEVKSEETTEKEPEKESTSRFERRIGRAIRARAEAQAKADLLEKELSELKRQNQKGSGSDNAPRMEDYTDVQEYAKAFATHQTEKALKEKDATERQVQSQQAQQRLVSDWETKAIQATAKYADFDEAVGDLKPTTPWAIAIMQAENGGEVAYFLGTHPKEAERIISLDPYSQIREIGKLELKLSMTPAEKKPSQAPKPIEPVSATAKVSGDEIEPNMAFEKYMKIGNKMFRGRR